MISGYDYDYDCVCMYVCTYVFVFDSCGTVSWMPLVREIMAEGLPGPPRASPHATLGLAFRGKSSYRAQVVGG